MRSKRFGLIILAVLIVPALAVAARSSAGLTGTPPIGDRANDVLADQFQSPFEIPTTTAYEEQWNIITNDTRYGVRNLSLTGRKCYGVAWNRMLHSALDLYRADGLDAAGTTVVAVADGQVAYYDRYYASYPGRVVILSHLLTDGRMIYSMYAHLGSAFVVQGQAVSRGQPIGTVLYQAGDSHLHFEMRWFLDGAWIYPTYTSCNGIVYGRGYTYLIHPDNFPAPDNGYVNADAFIQAHGGSALTPYGLPDPPGPLATLQTMSADVTIVTDTHPIDLIVTRPNAAAYDLAGPSSDASLTSSIKITPTLIYTGSITAPIHTLNLAKELSPSPSWVNTDTLTYTTYLPLIIRNYPLQEPACVEGQDLLANGNFEGGPGSAPWAQVRNGTSDLIDSTQHYSGLFSLWLGGRTSADEEALQSFVVPYYTDGLTLTFKRLMTNAQGSDHFEFVIENSAGNELTPQIGFTSASPNQHVWAQETVVFGGFQAWANRRARLSIKGMTYGTSNLFVDDVSVQTKCVP